MRRWHQNIVSQFADSYCLPFRAYAQVSSAISRIIDHHLSLPLRAYTQVRLVDEIESTVHADLPLLTHA